MYEGFTMYSAGDTAKAIFTVVLAVVLTELAVAVFWNYLIGVEEKRYKISKQDGFIENNTYPDIVSRPLVIKTRQKLSVIPLGEGLSGGHAHRQTTGQAKAYVHVYNTRQPVKNGRGIQCVPMKIDVYNLSTPICIYPPKEDTLISATLAKGSIFQRELLEPFVKLLRADTNMQLIDIGANLGIWTITAAKIGRTVLSVEPYPPTIARLHLSIVKGHLESLVTLVTDPISDRHQNVTFKIADKNKGGVSILKVTSKADHRSQTITIDDLVPYIPREMTRAFIKMDIEAMEIRALRKCDKLLRAIDVPVIMLEFFQFKNLLRRKELHQFSLWAKNMNYIPYSSLGKDRERLDDVISDNRYRRVSDLYLIKKDRLRDILRWTESDNYKH